MTTPDISLVVPIYNVEKYLRRCIESITAQTYKNIEIVLVDDGSQDKCGYICDEYKKNDPRINVFHTLNGGVAKARQLGVENSLGEYIVFVDPDDWLPVDAIEILHTAISENNIDIVVGSHTECIEDYPLPPKTQTESILSQEEYLNKLMDGTINWSPWAKIYNKQLFLKDSFPITKRSQDLLMNLDIAFRVTNIKCIQQSVYNYRVDMYTCSNKISFDVYDIIIKKVVEILEKYGQKDNYKKFIGRLAFNFLILSIINGFDIRTDLNWVILAKEYAYNNKLNTRNKIFRASFKSEILRRTLHYVYNNPLGICLRMLKRQHYKKLS